MGERVMIIRGIVDHLQKTILFLTLGEKIS